MNMGQESKDLLTSTITEYGISITLKPYDHIETSGKNRLVQSITQQSSHIPFQISRSVQRQCRVAVERKGSGAKTPGLNSGFAICWLNDRK